MMYFNERVPLVIVDRRKIWGIFRSLPLLFDILTSVGFKKLVVTSVYRNIEKYMFLPGYEFQYIHFSNIYIKKNFDVVLIYALDKHEKESQILSRSQLFPGYKVYVLDKPDIKVSSGKTLPDLYGITPREYDYLWSEYWKKCSDSPANLRTKNLALHKIAKKLSFYNNVRDLIVRGARHTIIANWLKNTSNLSDKELTKYLRYWFEKEYHEKLKNAILEAITFMGLR